jgi:hypothetical protein
VLRIVHFVDATRLNECFLLIGQPKGGQGESEGLVLYFRYESVAPNSPRVPCVKDFGAYATEEELVEAVESWIGHELFETWARSELCEPV